MNKQSWQVEVFNSIKRGNNSVSKIAVDIALPADWVRPAIEALKSKNAITGSDGSYSLK